jgi:nucleoside-triphosphatase
MCEKGFGNVIDDQSHNFLITGQPGVGKTTLVCRLAEELAELEPVGFYTSEIRARGRRVGFELCSFDGTSSLLSHVDVRSRHRVGRYGVDLAGFERFLDQIGLQSDQDGLLIIDEIGKMECYCDTFCHLVERWLNSRVVFVATIAQKAGGFIGQIRERASAQRFTVTATNRDSLPKEIAARIRELMR